MKAVVTGARGFVGRHLTRHLGELGVEVVSLDVDDARPVDITDRDAVARRIAEAAPDVVYHLAARSHVGASWTDGDALTDVNVGGRVRSSTRASPRASRACSWSAAPSSTAPSIRRRSRSTKRTECRPVSPYGKSKVAAEAVALEAHRDHGLAVVCTRAFNHTGPGQSPAFLVPGLAARIAAAERADTSSPAPTRSRSATAIPCATSATCATSCAPTPCSPSTAWPARPTTCARDAACASATSPTRLLARARRPLRVVTATDLVRAGRRARCSSATTRKLVAATGWQPEHDLDDTLDAVLDAARA